MEAEKTTSAVMTEEEWEQLIYSIAAEVDRDAASRFFSPSNTLEPKGLAPEISKAE